MPIKSRHTMAVFGQAEKGQFKKPYFLCDLAQLVDHVLGRGQIGVARAQVDDVPPRGACCGPHRVDFGDDIGRQALHAVELVVHDPGYFRQ